MGKFWHTKYRIPVVKTSKSFMNLSTSWTETTTTPTQGSTVLLSGCFAFLKQWRCMIRISVERAVEFLPCVLGSIPPGRPPTLNNVDTLWARCITLLFPLILSLSLKVYVRAHTVQTHTHLLLHPPFSYSTYWTFILFWLLPFHWRPLHYLFSLLCLFDSPRKVEFFGWLLP